MVVPLPEAAGRHRNPPPPPPLDGPGAGLRGARSRTTARPWLITVQGEEAVAGRVRGCCAGVQDDPFRGDARDEALVA